jgi:predicted phosphodiesterase
VRLQLLSDLHFEFHRDAGQSFVRSLDASLADVVVLAGDIAVAGGIADALALFSRHFERAQIVYVHGNHEFYGSDRASVLELTQKAVTTLPNVHFLDCSQVELDDQRILGAPLWFPPDPRCELFRAAMSDYSLIRDYASWVHLENARAVHFLQNELRPGDIVVTHHLPVRASISAQYASSPLNVYFLSDVEELIRERHPRVWLHGHTHDSVRVRVGATQVICNPFGYAPADLNRDFDERLVLDID